MQTTTRTMKPHLPARLLEKEEERPQAFSSAELRRHHAGHRDVDRCAPESRAAIRATGPLVPSPAASVGGPSPFPAEPPAAPTTAYKRILIADDDASVRASLAAVLESEGYVADQAQNGLEAVARAIEYVPDLVLLDLNMPHWDGWTAFTQLDRVTPLLPVIIITARPNQYQKAVGLGVDAFMEKPLNIPVLMRAIERLTSEDEKRHLRRITHPTFVTELLGGTPS